MNRSPWPDEGKVVQGAFRKGVWVLARPWYGNFQLTQLRRLFPVVFWFPFLTFKTKWVHCYIGWKPIFLEDPAFYWRELDVVKAHEGKQFVQLSARIGYGEIS